MAVDRHDQPPPVPNASRPIIELVLFDIADPLVAADLRERAEVGRARYGVYLQAHSGRDALLDAYQEAQDQVMYLRQAVEEAAGALEKLVLLELYAAAAGLLVRLRHAIARRRGGRP